MHYKQMLYYCYIKWTVQRKLTGVLSGINRKLMISSIAGGYFFKFKGPCPFKFKIAFFSVLINFRLAFLDNNCKEIFI
jgi:hypothetical protein